MPVVVNSSVLGVGIVLHGKLYENTFVNLKEQLIIYNLVGLVLPVQQQSMRLNVPHDVPLMANANTSPIHGDCVT
jgi:hypothetical protein